jgi:hypothetical protein
VSLIEELTRKGEIGCHPSCLKHEVLSTSHVPDCVKEKLRRAEAELLTVAKRALQEFARFYDGSQGTGVVVHGNYEGAFNNLVERYLRKGKA